MKMTTFFMSVNLPQVTGVSNSRRKLPGQSAGVSPAAPPAFNSSRRVMVGRIDLLEKLPTLAPIYGVLTVTRILLQARGINPKIEKSTSLPSAHPVRIAEVVAWLIGLVGQLSMSANSESTLLRI